MRNEGPKGGGDREQDFNLIGDVAPRWQQSVIRQYCLTQRHGREPHWRRRQKNQLFVEPEEVMRRERSVYA